MIKTVMRQQSKTSKRSTGGLSLKLQRLREIEEARSYALGKYNPSTGAEWRSKVERKRTKRSRTDGRTKNIKPTPLDKYMAKTSRSYKHRSYSAWLAKTSK